MRAHDHLQRTESTPDNPLRPDAPVGTATLQAVEMGVGPDDLSRDDVSDHITDAWEARMTLGIPSFDPGDARFPVLPDITIKERAADRTDSAGGVAVLREGERGCGKSTDNLKMAVRCMDDYLSGGDEMPAEVVVWRGSPHRSEWLPLAPWTTVWVSKGARIDPSIRPVGLGAEAESTDLEEWCREIRRYRDVVDLIERLTAVPPGSFHVVYPDPSFRGCEGLTRQSNRTGRTLPFRSRLEAGEDETPTPIQQWWFAFLLGLVDESPSQWFRSVFIDEMGEITPGSAENDDHMTHKKVKLFQDCMADSRRNLISIYGSIHRESQAAWQVLEEFDFWIDMPDGTANPTKNHRPSHPQGTDTVPMIEDIMSERSIGTALLFNEQHFQLFSFPDVGKRWESPGKLTVGLDPAGGQDFDQRPGSRGGDADD